MRIYLETERLWLREFMEGDARLLWELDSDPAVRQYLDMPEAPTPEQAAEVLARFIGWHARDGGRLGYWAAIEKSTGAFIGWFHFRPARDIPEETEVGYRLQRASWRKGYATEGAGALLRKGFTELGVTRVVARTLVENAASRRVMEKIGLAEVDRYLYDNRLPAVKYGLDRDKYTEQRQEKTPGSVGPGAFV